MRKVIIAGIMMIIPGIAVAVSPKCEQINAKIAKAESLVEFAKYNMPPAEAANAMVGARKQVARHRQEYHDLGCDGSVPAASRKPQKRMQPAMKTTPADTHVNIKESCIMQCKKYTTRSDEECFDACWKQ